MITRELVTELLHSKETFRIERTTSTTDKEKFGEAGGIATLQEELEVNGNGAAKFSFGLVTTFEATVMKSCNGPIKLAVMSVLILEIRG